MGKGPDDGLNNTDGKTEIDAGVTNELEFHMTGFQKHPVKQFLVAHQRAGDQILEIEHPGNVAFDVRHDLLDHVRRFILDTLDKQVLHGFRG